LRWPTPAVDRPRSLDEDAGGRYLRALTQNVKHLIRCKDGQTIPERDVGKKS
jgi:hypothetical protein